MSIIPEILFQRALRTGFMAIRQDPRMLDALFKNLSQQDLARVKSTILEKNIDLSINYPRSEIKVPGIIILLKNETEAQTFIGDHMGTSPNYDVPDTDLSFDILGGTAASVSTLSGLPRKIIGPLAVTQATSTSLRFNVNQDLEDLLYRYYESNPPRMAIHIVGGAGKGQVKPLVSLNSTFLDIFGTFSIPLDTTSLFDIRLVDNPESALGEPSRVYPQTAKNLQRLGANFEVQYQFDILAGSQEEVLYLFTVVKALLFAQRPLLESQGIMALKTSASDFAPRSEFTPDEIFQRSMVITFTYPFSFLSEINTFRELILRIIPHDAFTGIEPEDAVITKVIPLG